jgi:hypothetical protein
MPKIKRDAFLYYDGTDHDFAQCGTCWLWDPVRWRCAVIPSLDLVEYWDSCGYYGKGHMPRHLNGAPVFTPEEVGFVKRRVRCENCVYGADGATKCELFNKLNGLPDFELDIEIKPEGCCNAQTPRTP